MMMALVSITGGGKIFHLLFTYNCHNIIIMTAFAVLKSDVC